MSMGFAKQGADLVIMARRIERLEKVAEDIELLNAYLLNVMLLAQRKLITLLKSTEHYDKVDILVNNAGI